MLKRERGGIKIWLLNSHFKAPFYTKISYKPLIFQFLFLKMHFS